MKRFLSFAFVLFLAGCAHPGVPSPETPGIILPTMGWSSWNTYRVHISDSLIMRQADAMVETGLHDAGHRLPGPAAGGS